jgi:nucleoside-diphosphate-sugar epimerase
MKIVITGAAGLVGQNLVLMLLEESDSNLEIVAIDKNTQNLEFLKQLAPTIKAVAMDLATKAEWELEFQGADCVVLLNAQIGATEIAPFIRNNVEATSNVLDAIETHCPAVRVVHISSSVVNSLADDFYVQTKKEQEDIVKGRITNLVVLRPTLMFGWFDRKHLGWLARFMKASPIFPIPGSGRYVRQPLFVRDFCSVIRQCVFNSDITGTHEISGQEKIFYLDVIKAIKEATKPKCLIVKIPYKLFEVLLRLYALFDKDPPFTVSQLEALVIPEEFEVTNWPEIFNVMATRFDDAVRKTFTDPKYSQVLMKF